MGWLGCLVCRKPFIPIKNHPFFQIIPSVWRIGCVILSKQTDQASKGAPQAQRCASTIGDFLVSIFFAEQGQEEVEMNSKSK